MTSVAVYAAAALAELGARAREARVRRDVVATRVTPEPEAGRDCPG